jgi:hypothetical protein
MGVLPDGRVLAISRGILNQARTLTFAPSGMRKPGQFGGGVAGTSLLPRRLLATAQDRALISARVTSSSLTSSWNDFAILLDGSGGVVWQRPLTGSEAKAEILDDGTVLIGMLGDILRVRAQDGAPLWMESIVDTVPDIGPANAVWVGAGDGSAVQVVRYEPPGMLDSRRHAVAARNLDDGRLAWATVLEIGADSRLACATVRTNEIWSIWSISGNPGGATLRWERRRIQDGAQIATGAFALPPLDDPVCNLRVIGDGLILQVDTDVDASWILALGGDGVERWRDGGTGYRRALATALVGSSDVITSLRPSAVSGDVEHARRDTATGMVRWRTTHALPAGFTSALAASSSRILITSLTDNGVASIRLDSQTGSLVESTNDTFRAFVALPYTILANSRAVYELGPSADGAEGDAVLSERSPFDGRVIQQTPIPAVIRPASPWLFNLVSIDNETLALIAEYPGISEGTSNTCVRWSAAIIGINVREGRTLWRKEIKNLVERPFVQRIAGLGLRVDSYPAVSSTCGGATSRGEILDARSGGFRWSGTAGDQVQAALDGDLLRHEQLASGTRAWIRERLQPRTESWRREADSWTAFGIADTNAAGFTNVDLLFPTSQVRMRAQRRAGGDGSVVATMDIFDPTDPIEAPDFSTHADGFSVASARRLRSVPNNAPERRPVVTRWNPRTLAIDWQARPELRRGAWWTLRLPVVDDAAMASGDLLMRSIRYGRYYGSATMDASIAVATIDRSEGRVLFEQLAQRSFDLPLTSPLDWTPRVRLADGSVLATGTRIRVDGISVPYVERRAPAAIRGASLHVSADEPATPIPGRPQARSLDVRVENRGQAALDDLNVVITPIRELGHLELMLRDCVLTGTGRCPAPVAPNSPPTSLSLAPGATMTLRYEVRLHGWRPTISSPDVYGAVLRVDPPYSIGVDDLSETVTRIRIR